MAKEYIEREALMRKLKGFYCDVCIKHIRYGDDICKACEMSGVLWLIENYRVSDAAEVEHEISIEINPEYNIWGCSHCIKHVKSEGKPMHKYCPNCGAKMDGERREK